MHTYTTVAGMLQHWESCAQLESRLHLRQFIPGQSSMEGGQQAAVKQNSSLTHQLMHIPFWHRALHVMCIA